MIRVLLVDDVALLRTGLRAVLEQEGDISVCAEAGDGRAALREAREERPDLVLMDLQMPQMTGVE
ncbi:MAG TPA: response regulator transcription factor, partial [Solirubrobacter sp.]|nr:response regulator transcription factor [Solirubrobacter sp.]